MSSSTTNEHGGRSGSLRMVRRAVAVAVALLAGLALAAGPYADATERAFGTQPTSGVAAGLPSGPFQGDCGYLTCTLRFDRAQTKNLRDAGEVVVIVGGACGVVSGGTLAPICGLAVAPAAGLLAVAANRFYDEGNCIKIKITRVGSPPAAIPMALRRGTFNCV